MSLVNSLDSITDPDKSDGLYFLALTFGLMAKGPSPEELLGFVRHIQDNSVRLSTAVSPDQLVDISGTGGDTIKTFNVGSVSSIIVAAAGGHVAKQSTRGYTGFTGSADIFRSLGVDPFRVDASRVVSCLEEVGVTAFYTPAMGVGFANRVDFLTKLRTIGLTYPTPWHLVSWVYSPFKMTCRLYGVFDPKYLVSLAHLFLRLGYKRVMVVHGVDGLDEVSNVGPTKVAEVKDGEVVETTYTPQSLGVELRAVEEIQTLSAADLQRYESSATSNHEKGAIRAAAEQDNVLTFMRILYGTETAAKTELALVNSAAALYLCGLADDVPSGVAISRRAISSGATCAKLRQLVDFAGDRGLLDGLEKKL